MLSKCLHLSHCVTRVSAATLIFLFVTSWAIAQQTVKFVVVTLPDTEQADKRLSRYLSARTHLNFENEPAEYGAAVRKLANWPRGGQPYVARMTPYVYVAAEMLGANLKLLGTYRSAATGGGTTYSFLLRG